MERTTLQVGTFEVNCTILCENGNAWIFDPGNEAARIAAWLEEKGLSPAGIFLTHAHFDHIGGIPDLLERYPNLPVYLHGADAVMIGHPLNQLPPDYPPVASIPTLRPLPPENELPPGLRVIETPGHTPGGVCYFLPNSQISKLPNLLLSGDTLFAGSVGRTDLPGGDMGTLMDSLKKLTDLPDDTLVIPGHGPTTTIGQEKRSNPFLR